MPRPREAPDGTRVNIREVKAQLDLLTAKLREYESARCSVTGCNFVSDGLRLSQEVEILQKEIIALREENEVLKRKLSAV
jgi:hypothetical protein